MPEETKKNLPINLSISCRGFPSKEMAKAAGYGLLDIADKIGEYLDISILEGMTIAWGDEEYKVAIKEINPTSSPSEGDEIGVAMSIGKLDENGILKKHLVFKAWLFTPYFRKPEDFKNEEEQMNLIQLMIHTVAHELAHVETAKKLYDGNIYEILNSKGNNIHDFFRKSTMYVCWDEFSACFLSGTFGEDPHQSYEEILLKHIEKLDDRLFKVFKEYYHKQDHLNLFCQTYEIYFNLLKFSSYYLGNIKSNQIVIESLDSYKKIQDSDFSQYFNRLNNTLNQIHEDIESEIYDLASFEKIGNLLDELCLQAGLVITPSIDNVHVRLMDSAQQKCFDRIIREQYNF